MKFFLNRFLSLAFIILISTNAFAQNLKNSKSAILGVILEGDYTNFKEAKGVLGIQFKNIKSDNWSQENLILQANDSKGKQINQLKIEIDFSKLPEGYQFIPFEKEKDFALGSACW